MAKRQPKVEIIPTYNGDENWSLLLRVGNTYFQPMKEKEASEPVRFNSMRSVYSAANRISKATGFPVAGT